MAKQIRLIFLLGIVALVHGHVAVFENEQSLTQAEASLDKIIDDLLPLIHNFILKHGLDPTSLVDFSENIFSHLPGKLKGNIDFKNGWMQNLSNLKRVGPVNAKYENKILLLNTNFGFDVLDFNYEYNLQYLSYLRQGDLYGRFFNLEVNSVIKIDFVNYYLSLESIKFSKVGKYYIKFEGHIMDHILNAVTKLVTLVFRRRVLTAIEDRSMMIANAKIDEWNKSLPRRNRAEIIENWFKV